MHGELDSLPVWASITTTELMGAPVDVLEGNGHFPGWRIQAAAARVELLVAALG